ncbi:MAG: pentapeptide repeat-containing protein [Proteobacteria bacterium]|nr:pentapeptide repeat-containing protein [Pseudomonadota bacterium]MBU1688536.1 pentapeptide repeat-containing protein [Pseudomonadota bacterium]
MEGTIQAPVSRDNALELLERLRGGEKIAADALNFRGVSLRNRDLSGLNLNGADFTEADLSGTNLAGCRFFKTKFRRASLVKADLSGAEMTAADLTFANLEEARADNAGLGMAILTEAKLFNAILTGATLTKATLTDADFRCVNLEGARMRETDLRGADFTGANLRHVDLARSRVEKAIFNNADLREARLRQMTGFEGAEWIGVDIRDINFAGAYRLRRFVVDQNYLLEFRSLGRLNRWIYLIWLLTSDCGRSLSRWCLLITLVTLLFTGLYAMVGLDYGKYPDWIAPFYFSVVTLSTLGYGDIVPATYPARIIAIIEVMIGYMLLGGLLSIFTNKMARRGE